MCVWGGVFLQSDITVVLVNAMSISIIYSRVVGATSLAFWPSVSSTE